MEDTAIHTGMNGSGPLTVVVSWQVKPGNQAAFEEWHRGISAAALTFPGHLGVTVIRPSQTTGEHTVIFKFDALAHLAAWQESALRREWPTGVYGGAYRHGHTPAPGAFMRSTRPCGNPLHQHTHTVLGETGGWGIRCSCFAF